MKEDSSQKKAYWKYSEEYHSKHEDVCIEWFRECWKKACASTNTDITTCLARHESATGVELKTGKYLSEEDIKLFFDS